MSEGEAVPTVQPDFDSISDDLKRALDDMAAVTAEIEKMKTVLEFEKRCECKPNRRLRGLH